MGWAALSKADAELLLARVDDGMLDTRVVNLAREARGHFKDAGKLLEEVTSAE